jgi:hypothetical protein
MIRADERAVLTTLRFNPAPTPDDVWRPSPYDVPELHTDVVREIVGGINKARHDDAETPYGVAMQGRAGAGKTHLLGAVRDKIQHQSGYFFLVNLINGKTFWESTALSMVEGLGKEAVGWGTQLKTYLRRLSSLLNMPAALRDAICGDAPLSRQHVAMFVSALRTLDREVGRACQDTARALVLHGSQDFQAQDVAYAHLMSEPADPTERADWGFTPAIRTPQQIVRDISRLMALTLDPTVIAIDQLDTLFAQTSTAFFSRREGVEESHARQVAPIADGLLMLRDITQRTLVVVSCLPDTWELMKRVAPTPVTERFRDAHLPDRISSPAIGAAIVAKRFALKFAAQRFVPPYATWPIAPAAFADAPTMSPRGLLRRVDRHVTWCLDHDEVVELDRLVDDGAVRPQLFGSVDAFSEATVLLPTLQVTATEPTEVDLRPLDVRFAELVAAADVDAALDPNTEDLHMPALLAAGLATWIDEQAPAGSVYKHDPPPGKKPALHGRLIEVLDESTENEAHWGFRAIASTSAVAVISRVKAACTLAGLDREIPQRRLTLLRNAPWPSGPRSAEVREAFIAAGGTIRPIAERDLRIFAALRDMREYPDARFHEWLRARRPASSTELLSEFLSDDLADSGDSLAGGRGDLTVDGADSGALGSDAARLGGARLGAAGLGGPSTNTASSRTAQRAAGSTEAVPGEVAAILRESTSASAVMTATMLARLAARGRPADRAGSAGGSGVPGDLDAGFGAGRFDYPDWADGASDDDMDIESVKPDGVSIPLGTAEATGAPFALKLESLRRHTVIFAGSGSGKTVLIRRLVEDCARQGVSSIVLDPNNDLARLGEPWPTVPRGWGRGDAARAMDFLDNTDVVVWTPRVSAGRPLAFQPLPDFSVVRDSPDEFDQATRSAVEALAPRAGVTGTTKVARRGKAVLTEALQAYARTGRTGLRGFTEFLADLPVGVSRMTSAAKLAHEAAETLKAAMVTDPLFGGSGTLADPDVLFTPTVGRRARVSVISFVGLTSDEQRQGFVHQLQMALFNWIKRHPAGDRPLSGLFVMDEAQTLAPSGGTTPCTASTVALASQARKYGLGLVFATQAPKSLHNQISGNATTQFFGLLNAPVQIDTARDLARAKGGALPDIGLLESGQFYAAGEGFSFVKVRTPMCLTYHPNAPLSPEEVIDRAE